jgi:hypothetical protein
LSRRMYLALVGAGLHGKRLLIRVGHGS